MKKFGIVAAVLIAGFVVWGFLYPSGSWRYRLTLEVETPEGVKTGSSVRLVSAAAEPQITPEAHPHARVTGEAVVVDLGNRGVLFALISSPTSVDYGHQIVFDLFPFVHDVTFESGRTQTMTGSGELTAEGIRFYASLAGTAAGALRNVPVAKLPILVRFRDITDPKTVEIVDPNDLAKSFGAGVSLKSSTIEMVDNGIWPLTMFGITGEPVTTGIGKKLLWLEDFYDLKLDGRRIETIDAPNRLANSLSSGAFKTEKN